MYNIFCLSILQNKSDAASTSTAPEFDLNKARLEVQKFGYSGFDYDDRRKFEQERAIKLGAKVGISYHP